MRLPGRLLRLSVFGLVMGGLFLPILAGLWQTGQAAFGILPAIGAKTVSITAFRDVFALPGFTTSLRLTLVTGIGSTLLSLCIALALASALPVRMGRWLALPLALPHAALAIGLAFLIAPSGWIIRIISPWATGWQHPPELATVNDPWGAALILGLVIKEVPFLLLVVLSAMGQGGYRMQIAVGRALGHSAASVWIKIVLPQIYRLIRLPLFITLAFALSVVDMALVLGPSNPPTLAVAVTRWFVSPNPAMILPASAGAVVQVALIAVVIALWMGAERLIPPFGRIWLRRGGRGAGLAWLLRIGRLTGAGLALLGIAAIVVLLIWSVTWRWSFANVLPETWSLHVWQTAGWQMAFVQTLLVGVVTTTLALCLAIAWLEGEDRGHLPRARWAAALIALPLLVPQIGFLYGLNVLFLRAGLSGGMLAVIWAQFLFVFPYVMITLSDPWRALDPRLIRSAAALGAGPLRRLWFVKLPLLLRPVLVAAALGFAVSVAQYLPTLFMGAGRVITVTTEAVTLSSGSDRRVAAVYAVLQAVLPAVVYGLALLVPTLVYRHRRGMEMQNEP